MFQAVLDSWKDWTGARYIYINFPDQLNLRKIKLYRKENSEHVSLFNYVVIVECDGANSKEKQARITEFLIVLIFIFKGSSILVSSYYKQNVFVWAYKQYYFQKLDS